MPDYDAKANITIVPKQQKLVKCTQNAVNTHFTQTI